MVTKDHACRRPFHPGQQDQPAAKGSMSSMHALIADCIAQSVVRGPTEAQGGQDGVPSSAKVLEAFVAKCVPVGVVVDEWSRHAII